MRKSFEKYMKENSNAESNLSSSKKYIIGFIIGLFFVGTFSYAANSEGTIGKLFEKLTSGSENGNNITTDIYRLDGENIKDGSVTEYELANSSVTTGEIKDKTIQKKDLADGIVDGDIIKGDSITNTHLKKDSVWTKHIKDGEVKSADIEDGTILTKDVSSAFVAPSSDGLKYTNSTGNKFNFKAITEIGCDFPNKNKQFFHFNPIQACGLSTLLKNQQKIPNAASVSFHIYALWTNVFKPYVDGKIVTSIGGTLSTDKAPSEKAVADYVNSKVSSLPTPPSCTGSNKALQWNGSRFNCITIQRTTIISSSSGGGSSGPSKNISVSKRINSNGSLTLTVTSNSDNIYGCSTSTSSIGACSTRTTFSRLTGSNRICGTNWNVSKGRASITVGVGDCEGEHPIGLSITSFFRTTDNYTSSSNSDNTTYNIP